MRVAGCAEHHARIPKGIVEAEDGPQGEKAEERTEEVTPCFLGALGDRPRGRREDFRRGFPAIRRIQPSVQNGRSRTTLRRSPAKCDCVSAALTISCVLGRLGTWQQSPPVNFLAVRGMPQRLPDPSGDHE